MMDRGCPKHVEFHSKNKFEKLVHLVSFIIGNSLNKVASDVVPTCAGSLYVGAGVLVATTNRAPSVMTVTPHFYQYVQWPLLLQRCASVAVELSGAIRIFSANLSLVK